MKNFTYTLLIILALSSCGSSKNNISKTSEDKALVNAIKKLDKNPQNAELRTTLKSLYEEAAKSHLNKIDSYNDLTGTEKWDKIIPEYEALKKLAEVISSSSVATNLLNVSNYGNELQASKAAAADEYYQSGIILLKDDNKMSAREAYYAFRRANELVPNYKDSKKQMDSAFKAGTINVVVNPVRDNTFYSNTIGRNNYGNQFNNENFQQNLVRDLGGSYNKSATNSLIYTDWEARRQNVRSDWEIDITWTDLNIPQPITYQSQKTVSKQIESSRDTSGKIYYQTVTATVYTSQRQYTANGDMEVRITDMDTRKTVLSTRFSEQYNWQDESSTYSGDRRALEGYDLSRMSNTGRYREPRKEDILNELYRRLYPQVRNRIQTALRF